MLPLLRKLQKNVTQLQLASNNFTSELNTYIFWCYYLSTIMENVLPWSKEIVKRWYNVVSGWKSHETNKTSRTVKWTQETCDFVGGKGKEELSLICSFSFHLLVRILYDIKWHVACLKKFIHIMSIIYCRCISSLSSWPTYIVQFLLNWNNVRYILFFYK